MDDVLQPFGVNFFAPGWESFRETAKGYDADMIPDASQTAMQRIHFDPATGILETMRLESGDGCWYDYGGGVGSVVPAQSAMGGYA